MVALAPSLERIIAITAVTIIISKIVIRYKKERMIILFLLLFFSSGLNCAILSLNLFLMKIRIVIPMAAALRNHILFAVNHSHILASYISDIGIIP
jgi:hypothetical protein